MAFKMNNAPFQVHKPGHKGKPSEHAYPGNNNKLTPDTLYTSDGEATATSQIDESFLGDSTETDSLGQYAHYKDETRSTKYYYKKPK
tara:strand:- start:197 stop:457 length:261 start_codon:yes stop_codon:yes gene_type:complete